MSLQVPFTFTIDLTQATLSRFDKHIQRHLSSMRGQYADSQAYEAMLAREDTLLYQVYENVQPSESGELPNGLSVLHPGKVGDEYFMTKGHFHAVLETGEVYHCLKGQGMIVMETPEGDWAVEPVQAGRILYVPPRWAHRSVNVGSQEDLVTYYVYPGHAGHDYGTIEKFGFRKLVVDRGGTAQVIDNPRWQAPHQRV